MLLETIGLKNFTPSEKGINIKSFKETFLATGRLDAEYYQPKYEDYIDLVRNYKNGCELLQTACNLKDSNYTPEEIKEYQYIELADIGKSGNITGCTVAPGTILTAINKTDFQNVPVPIIDSSTQQQISVLIQQSFTFRTESERLLAEAKEMVEREIEK